MGTEFLMKTGNAYRKYLDKKLMNLKTPNLFTRVPNTQPRSAIAKASGEATLVCGEQLIVETRRNHLVAARGSSVVAQFTNPPTDIIAAINASGGKACGTIQKVNQLSGTFEISIT